MRYIYYTEAQHAEAWADPTPAARAALQIKLVETRQRCGLTQAAAAAFLGVSRQRFNVLENKPGQLLHTIQYAIDALNHFYNMHNNDNPTSAQ